MQKFLLNKRAGEQIESMGLKVAVDIWEGQWLGYKLSNNILCRLNDYSDGGMECGKHDCTLQPHLE